MDGGGLHQTLRDGHLNIHADFSTHHTHENWARRVNILLYLNREWRDDWGGKLELWDEDMTACQARVTPAGNRMLVFTTSGTSFHGHPDGLTCPPDVARRSMALYYFTQEDHVVRQSTNYRARPEDGRRKAAIGADRTALDLYDRVKRRLGISDEKVQSLLARLDRSQGLTAVRRRTPPAARGVGPTLGVGGPAPGALAPRPPRARRPGAGRASRPRASSARAATRSAPWRGPRTRAVRA